MTARARHPVVLVHASRGFARHAKLARRAARTALREMDETACELSVALVGDEEMRGLNRSFRGKDRPTDVLAFAQREGEVLAAGAAPSAGAAPALLGDVVVSVPTAERQAAARRIPLEREIATLLVHGILHLLGYDHERSPAEARRMFRRQREVLAAIAPTPEPAPAGRATEPARAVRAAKPAPPAQSAKRVPATRRRSLADRRSAR